MAFAPVIDVLKRLKASVRRVVASQFTAGLTQLNEDRLPHKDNGDEAADWGSRTARVFATRTTSTVFIRGIYPALFKQDPRYERSRSRKFGPRVAHAIGRVFVTRDDDGKLEPNYSRFAEKDGVYIPTSIASYTCTDPPSLTTGQPSASFAAPARSSACRIE